MNLKKKCPVKPYYFLMIDNAYEPDDPLRFRKNLLEILLEIQSSHDSWW